MNDEYVKPLEDASIQEKKTRYLCAHCKWGMIYRIPAECPECGKILNKEVVKGQNEE